MTIKEFRNAQGLTQPKLAEALGIGASTVAGYESGRINPSAKVIAKIQEVFGVDLNAAAVEEQPAEKKPAAKRTRRKAEAAPVAEEKIEEKVEEKKAAEIIIQSPMGGEISIEEILAKVGPVDKVYIRVDQNAAYWVRGDESGVVNLW